MENEWKNKKRIRKGLKARAPLYTAQDAIDVLITYNRPVYKIVWSMAHMSVKAFYTEELRKQCAEDVKKNKNFFNSFDKLVKYHQTITVENGDTAFMLANFHKAGFEPGNKFDSRHQRHIVYSFQRQHPPTFEKFHHKFQADLYFPLQSQS